MRKITKKEFKEMPFVSNKGNGVIEALTKVAIGHGLFVSKSDWKYKTKPANMVHVYFSRKDPKKKFSVYQMEDKSGWAILRVQ